MNKKIKKARKQNFIFKIFVWISIIIFSWQQIAYAEGLSLLEEKILKEKIGYSISLS